MRLAIALFVFDVPLVMFGWPPTSPGSSFAENQQTSAATVAGGLLMIAFWNRRSKLVAPDPGF